MGFTIAVYFEGVFWWRRRESNPRPTSRHLSRLQA